MFKLTALFFFACVAASLAGPTQPVTCGEMPTQIYSCLGSPTVIPSNIADSCKEFTDRCEKNTCIFRKSGWLNGSEVNNAKVAEFFDELASGRPEWTTAVQQTKTACLTAHLPPQSIYNNCPAYDVMLCTLASFFKNAQPAQWVQTAECEFPRQYAESCPVCPKECLGTTYPEGTCNAC